VLVVHLSPANELYEAFPGLALLLLHQAIQILPGLARQHDQKETRQLAPPAGFELAALTFYEPLPTLLRGHLVSWWSRGLAHRWRVPCFLSFLSGVPA
jgi:hypothetical protein